MRHRLKIHPEEFAAVRVGLLRAQWRRDDRERRFKIGDDLELAEWDPDGASFTGAEVMARVTHVLRDAFEMPSGFAILSIDIVA